MRTQKIPSSGAEKEKSRKSGKSGKSDKSKKSKKSMKSGKSGKSGKDRGDKEVKKVRKHLVKAEQKELTGNQESACKNIGKAQKHFTDGKLEGDDAIVVETMIANYLAANCPA